MVETVLAIVSTLLALAVAACIWLWRQRSNITQQRDAAQRTAEQLRGENAQLGTEIAVARETQKGIEKSHATLKEQFDEARKQLRASFAELSNEALDQSSKRFLELAAERLGNQQKQHDASLAQRSQAIEQMLKPIRESLNKHEAAVKEIEKSREGAYGSLRQHLADLRDAQGKLGRQTTALETALRGSTTTRGAWGEIALERIAELAGMTRYCDFDAQVTIHRDDQQKRPDMVVHLPAGRDIIVDAKAVGGNYLQACGTPDVAERKQLLEKHIGDIESRVRELSSKGYTDALPSSIDFVVMFIPVESLFSAAVSAKPEMMEEAIRKGVVIATPTTLIPLLRAVALGWREEKLAENAKRIQDLGVELHERIAVATGHVDDLGKALERATKCYNKFVGSYETRVVTSARKFKELGADSSKELPAEGAVTVVETMPRELRAGTDTAVESDASASA